jgi:DNA-binding transcriptional regulator YdaS (Cro superfamily)
LLRHSRLSPLRGGHVGAGEIEHSKRSGQVLAINEAVHGSATDERLREQVDWASGKTIIQLICNGE